MRMRGVDVRGVVRAGALALALAGAGCAGPLGTAPAEPGETDVPAAQGVTEGGKRLDLDALPEGCRVDATCGELVAVDCGQAADGPYYYVERATGRILEVCGGACMLRGPENPYCQQCPPAAWTCD